MIRERDIQTRTLRFHVAECGKGPLLLLLHGVTANARGWDKVAERLAEGFHVVAVDQRGHGRSDKPAKGYDGVDYASDIAALVETLGTGPAVVVGHSLGARNGIVAGVKHPKAVAGVVAVDYVPFIEPEVLQQLHDRVVGGNRTFASVHEVKAYLRARYPLMPEDAVERRAHYGYREENGALRPLADPAAMAATCRGFQTEDFATPTRDVRAPVIFVRGKESKLVTRAAFRRAQALRPDIRAVEVDGADHYVPEEQPDAIARITADFCALIGHGGQMQDGIEWSAPVVVQKGAKGKLMIEIPKQALTRLGVKAGDVVSYTAFANGGIEVWSIKKSPYTSLADKAKGKAK
ncbi:MAG TPA: alpha/beta hydrolase [Alphaproteobacteria bacterium]|jgi:2-(acetamidomethylene)succinate hydrolase